MASLLQSWRPVGRVPELGSLGEYMRSISLIGLVILSVGCASDDQASLARFLDYRALTRLTETQIDVEASVMAFCRDPKDIHGPHIKPGIHLYVSREVLEGKRTPDSSRYPIGSLVVKEKFDIKGDAKPNVITVMEKVADERRVQDWRFYMIRLSDRSFVRDEAKVSCVDCHSRFARSDFVSPVTDELVTDFTPRPNKSTRSNSP